MAVTRRSLLYGHVVCITYEYLWQTGDK